MAADIRIIPAIYEHIAPIAIHMRQADRDEVFAASGSTPFEALERSLSKSTLARTALVDGVPSVMFGVGDINILAGVGAPWLLGTDAVEQNYIAFLRGSVEWRDQLLQRYSVLKNFVDVRNRASIRWLRWLGFTLSDPMAYRGHEFRLFELRQDDVRPYDGADNRLNADRRGGADAAGAGNGEIPALQRPSAGNECYAGGSPG